MHIEIFKIISGEEILSEVVTFTPEYYTLKNPAQIAINPKEDGTMGIMVAAWMPYAEEHIRLYTSAIVSKCFPAEGLANEYKTRFTDDPVIQMPDRKIII
jgi:hypothetical protein